MKPAPQRLALVIENVKLDAIGENGIVPDSASDESHVSFVFVRGDNHYIVGLK